MLMFKTYLNLNLSDINKKDIEFKKNGRFLLNKGFLLNIYWQIFTQQRSVTFTGRF